MNLEESKSASEQDRNQFESYHRIFEKAVTNYEATNPEWRSSVIISLAELGLLSLKRYVEAPSKQESRWESPYIDFEYSADIDWDAWTASKYLNFQTLQLTKGSIEGEAVAEKTLAGAMVKHFTITALSGFTAWAVFEKRGDTYEAFLSREQAETLAHLPDPRQKELFLKMLHHPFSFGAGVFSFDETEGPEFRSLSSDQNEEFRELSKLIHEPLLSKTTTIDGKTLESRVIFQVHPLTIDPEQKKAFFTITTGIFLQPIGAADDPLAPSLSWANPANWPAKDRAEFLESLLKSVRELHCAEPDEMTEKFITVNAQLKISVRKSDIAGVDTASGKILCSLLDLGTVTHFHLDHEASVMNLDLLRELLKAVTSAHTSAEKGRALEKLIKILFTTVSGFEEVQSNVLTATEEIDISIINRSTDPTLKHEGQIILAECKNWSSKCRKDDFVTFHAKIANRKQRARLGFLISWNGFSDTIPSEMLRGSREETLIVPLDGRAIEQAVKTGKFLPVLLTGWKSATHL